jgi:hypothetical protein
MLATTAATVSLLLAAGPAAAANFGFVRWPAYLDLYILVVALPVALSLVWLKLVLPKGMTFYNLPKEQRTAGITFAGRVGQISFCALMILVFVGMGLQRAVE